MLNEHSVFESNAVKVAEFSNAIGKYNTHSWYTRFEMLAAVIVVTLQTVSVINLLDTYHYHGLLITVTTIVITYLATDFFNGLTHMIIDNNTSYSSSVGPFIAAFHLHHFKRKYTEQHPLKIYFTESGHKFWLVVYLILLTFAQQYLLLDSNLALGLVMFGILSSCAEISHYWCHNPPKNNAIILFLQKSRILLSLKHHRHHHTLDNMNYAFLNGISDPLLNIIARNYYKGYKTNSDMHVSGYMNSLDY